MGLGLGLVMAPAMNYATYGVRPEDAGGAVLVAILMNAKKPDSARPANEAPAAVHM